MQGRRTRGFSLVEQLIGLVVTSMVITLGLPDYSDFVQNRQIRSRASSIADGLQIARLEAVRRNEPVEFRLAFGDWRVVVPSTNEVVQMRPGAETGRATVALSDSSTAINVAFNGMGRVTSGNAATSFLVQPVSGACAPTGAYRCMVVQMSPGGQVRSCDPQLPSGDPQSCSS